MVPLWLPWKYLKDTKSEWLLFTSILMQLIFEPQQCHIFAFQHAQTFCGMVPK